MEPRVITVTTADLVSMQKAAELLGKPRMTIYRWVNRNKIHAIRLNGQLYVPVSEVERIQKEKADSETNNKVADGPAT